MKCEAPKGECINALACNTEDHCIAAVHKALGMTTSEPIQIKKKPVKAGKKTK